MRTATRLLTGISAILAASTITLSVSAAPVSLDRPVFNPWATFQVAEGKAPNPDGFVTKIIGKWQMGSDKQVVEFTKDSVVQHDKDMGEVKLPLLVVEEDDDHMLIDWMDGKYTLKITDGNLQFIKGSDVVDTLKRAE